MNTKTIFKSILIIAFVGIIITIAILLVSKNTNIPTATANILQMENQNEQEKKIFDTISSEASYKADPTEPSNLLDSSNRYIIKVKVLDVGEAEFLPKTDLYNNPYTPSTPIKVEIIDTLYGENVQPKDNIIYISGGNIKISNYEKNIDETDIARLGINELTEGEKESQYLRFTNKYFYNVEIGQEYVVIVGKIGNDTYKIVDEGCGIFIPENNDIADRSAVSNKLVSSVSEKTFTENELINIAKEKSNK